MSEQLTDIDKAYGTVTARIVLAYADGGDENQSPDFYPPKNSSVKFTPVHSFSRLSSPGSGVFVLNESVACRIDSETGNLIGPDGGVGVRLLADPGVTDGTPRASDGVEYTVTFHGEASRLPTHKITVKPGETLDLFSTVK